MSAALALPLTPATMPDALPDAAPFRPLTPRQAAVAQLVASGLTNREIAHALGLSRFTVKRHLEEIALRLPGAGTLRARVIRYVLRYGPIGA